MLKALVAVVHAVLTAAAPALTGDVGQVDPVRTLSPLLGRWVAESDPKAPGVTGGTSFTADLQGRIVVRKNHAQYAAQNGRPASSHEDLMVVFSEGGHLRADYFDNEGHVIHYQVRQAAPSTLTFLSDPHPGAPRFRLTYSWPTPGSLQLAFEMAPPGQPEQFHSYITARLRKA